MLEEFLNDFLFGDAAIKMVAHAHKRYEEGNKMVYFVILNGIGAGKLPTAIENEHNYKMIIDAIHDYQAKYPKKQVKEGYTYALSCTITVINGRKSLGMVLDYLNYEFVKQKNGTNAFRLDFDTLIDELKVKVEEKMDILRGDDPGFDRWIREQFEILEQKSWER